VNTFPCGDAQAFMIDYLTTYFTTVVGDVSLISDCLTADTIPSLVARIEAILATAKLWEEDIGTEEEFKNIDWEWLTFDLTQQDITDELLEVGFEGMEEIQSIVETLINDSKLIDVIQTEIGNRAGNVTTTVSSVVATTAAPAATTTTAAVIGAPATTAGNPYAPGQGMINNFNYQLFIQSSRNFGLKPNF